MGSDEKVWERAHQRLDKTEKVSYKFPSKIYKIKRDAESYVKKFTVLKILRSISDITYDLSIAASLPNRALYFTTQVNLSLSGKDVDKTAAIDPPPELLQIKGQPS